MDTSEEALILKTGRFREHDVWVRYLSPGRGVATAFAFGGRVSRRRFGGCLEPLSLVRFQVGTSRTGSYLQLLEGQLLEPFARLRSDLPRLGMAVNCLKFAEVLDPSPEGAALAFAVLVEALGRLCRPAPVPDVWPLLVRARLAFGAGYAPELSSCLRCAKPVEHMTAPRFAVEQGRVVCAACAATASTAENARPSGLGLLLPASAETLVLLAGVLRNGPEQWDGLGMEALSGRTRRECYDIVERFVEFHLGLSQSGTGFRRA